MQGLEKILEEIKSALKDTYLDIANNYDVSDLEYDSDKVACVASKFRSTVSERIEDIIRKHMNACWIPVEERMPTQEECEDYWFWIAYGYDNDNSPHVATGRWVFADDENGNDVSYSEFYFDQAPCEYTPPKTLIQAWKIIDIPEPYRPERNDNRAENEAIKHCEKRAEVRDKCGEEHKQLAEWLKELLKYREIGTVEEFRRLKERSEDNG